MTLSADQRGVFEEAARGYPYPVAVACRRFLDSPAKDEWQEWERLSRDVLPAVLQYLSHLLLSDLVATERKPPRLFHRIESILSRPLTGHYVGFLRDTAVYYRDENLVCAVPELISFVLAADADCSLTGDGKPLLGTLVDYRNLWAHGRPENAKVTAEIVEVIRRLTTRFLEEVRFLTRYPLQLGDGPALMGSHLPELPTESMPLIVITAGAVSLRPLLLKLKGSDLAQLDEADLSGMRLGYRGSSGYTRLQKKDLKSGDGAKLFEEMKALVSRVRAVGAVLESPDWTTFNERSAVVTDRVLALYEDGRKYVPRWYVPRPGWHGPEGSFRKFLDSDRSLLAISGVQGTGKSALAANLAAEAREAGHAVLFINAQRFTFADVSWTGTPYPAYFASLLHYSSPFDRAAFARIVKTAEPGKQVVLFIDAINEVDGIEAKWNRFRAMELLLEWLVSIAQPGLRVVLSFRVDAYEEYEYLQAEELPPTLGSIAYPGNHPTQPWVIELEPFDEAQAEALFHHLQKEPQFGMAPAMSWEEIRNGLGPRLTEFTENPLLFGTLLRLHHRATRVQAGGRDEMLQRYTMGLTGAAELASRPPLRRALGYLRNGNLTPKERLLAVFVEKIARQGALAVLPHELSRKQKLDRRLLETLNEPTDPTLTDLKDGGLLQQEMLSDPGAPEGASRIAFVAELLALAMEQVSAKVRRVARVRDNALMVIMIGALCGFSVVMFRVATVALMSRLNSRGIPGDLLQAALTTVSRPAYPVLLFAAFVCLSLYLLVDALSSRGYRGWSELGHFAYFIDRTADATYGRVLDEAVWPTVGAAWLVTAVCMAADRLELAVWSLTGILAMAIAFTVRWQTQAGNRARIATGLYRVAPRSRLQYATKVKAALAGDLKRSSNLRIIGAVCAWAGIMLGILYIQSSRWHPADESPARSLLEAILAGAGAAASDTTRWATRKVLPATVGGLAAAGLGLAWLQHRGKRVAIRAYDDPRTLRNVMSPQQLRRRLGTMLLLCWSTAVGIGLIHMVLRARRLDLTWLRERGLSAVRIGLDGRLHPVRLDLSGLTLSVQDLERIYRVFTLEELVLPDSVHTPIDLRQFGNLFELTAPAAAVGRWQGADVSGMTLSGLTARPGRGVAAKVKRIALRNSAVSGVELSGMFPRLTRLAVDEPSARAIGSPPDLGINGIVTVTGEQPARLEWMTPDWSRYIVYINAPVDEASQHLDTPERLWLTADRLEPAILLQCAKVRWLMLRLDRVPDRGWVRSLRESIEAGVPDLRTLELVSLDPAGRVRTFLGGMDFAGRIRTYRGASGRPAILEMLRRYEEDPELIFREDRSSVPSAEVPNRKVSGCREPESAFPEARSSEVGWRSGS